MNGQHPPRKVEKAGKIPPKLYFRALESYGRIEG